MVAAGLGAESIRGEYEQIFLFFTRKACEMLIGAQLYKILMGLCLMALSVS
jgi:hypothetical protein